MAIANLCRVGVLTFGLALAALFGAEPSQIPVPTDAPKPLSPADSAKCFRVPDGYRLDLMAAEPVINEPASVCWDERGRLFVCELHGYNLEGQHDIEEQNKTGKLDHVVRRIQASDTAQKAALAGTYGTVKRLIDSKGDGHYDKAEVWADRLPPCYGICPGNGGVIIACAPDIVFLSDRSGKIVRETLFTGFPIGGLERGVNAPQWGPDNWIYFGKGHGGGTIRGPHLKQPVQLPNTDFRIRADGSAIEPITGSTKTIGMAFTESGDRFVISTRSPAIFVAPLSWQALGRNPYVAVPKLEYDNWTDSRAYPTSQPHPWRTRRADDPGFSKYYTKRYGVAESAPNGYYTSACSPLVYQDTAMPALRGQLLACEPAQNFIGRAVIERDGSRLNLKRAPGEEKSEFLPSTDPWFHPINLATAPDGSIWIVDFYREIIEDYSAIPRYLQQQYGLVNGKDRGRLWRLSLKESPHQPAPDLSNLTPVQLAQEIGSGSSWHRQTARRLLLDAQAKQAASALQQLARESKDSAIILEALQTLDGLGELPPALLEACFANADSGVRRRALQLAERRIVTEPTLLQAAVKLASDAEPMVRLQLALALGECRDDSQIPLLAQMARRYGNETYLPQALLSSLSGRCGAMLAALLREPKSINQAAGLLEPLCAAITARRDPQELSDTLVHIAAVTDVRLQTQCLRGLRASIKRSEATTLPDEARAALTKLAAAANADVREHAKQLTAALMPESSAQRRARLDRAAKDVGNSQVAAEAQLAAVALLAADDNPATSRVLLDAFASSTPPVREAILAAALARRDRFATLLDALDAKTVPASALSALQRAALLADRDPAIQKRAQAVLAKTSSLSDELYQKYVKALSGPRDTTHGLVVFREKCGSCHKAHGVGIAVGPDLTAEFQRAEETLIRDILAPSDVISPGFTTYTLTTVAGQIVTGLLSSESPTSVTLRQAEGKDVIVLRKDIEELRASTISLMPDDLAKTVSPQDVADAIAWLRRPPTRLMLVDENRELLAAFNDGKGELSFVTGDAFSGQLSLRVTPPQRAAARINGWDFRIRERPAAGEFRYLRFAWKSADATGIMIELAASGKWPPAEKPLRRYFAGKNSTGWAALEVAAEMPRIWTVVTRDLWKDFGEFTLTGMAPTTMGAPALFDRVELMQALEEDPPAKPQR